MDPRFTTKYTKKSNLVCRNGVSKMFGAPASGELSSFSPPEGVAAGVAASVAASGDGGAILGSVPVVEGPQLCLQLPVATAQLQVPRDELERGREPNKKQSSGHKKDP